MATATVTRNESMVDTLTRLADKARKEGIQLYQSRTTGQFFATSGTTDGKRYAVSAYSCECKGYERFGYCKHVAAFATAHGLITRPEETPVAAHASTACRHCDGRGYWITARNLGRGQYERHDEPCPHCDGTGQDANADRMAA